MPAVDAATGRVLLEAPDRLALSPNGHGGTLAAFADPLRCPGGAMDDARRRGIRQLFYFQVDNPLVDIAGAEYIGYHILAGAEMTTQVIAKRDPLEKVGNVVAVDGRLMVIEYSDLPDDVARIDESRRLAEDLGGQHRGTRVRSRLPRPRRQDNSVHKRTYCRFMSRTRRSPSSSPRAAASSRRNRMQSNSSGSFST